VRVRVRWDKPHPYRVTITQWELELERSALVLMDFQHAYADPEVGLGVRLARDFPTMHAYYFGRLRQTVLPNAARLLDSFRRLGLPVIFTRLGTQLADGRDLPAWSWRAAQQRAATHGTRVLYPLGAPEHAIIPELAPARGDLVLDRPTLSPFNASPFDQVLRNMGIENLVLCGPLTEGAPETTARGAGERGYSVFLVEDACASLTEADHRDTFSNLAWCVSRSTDEVLALFEPLGAAAR
jgi:nicotinamidase-related amidase